MNSVALCEEKEPLWEGHDSNPHARPESQDSQSGHVFKTGAHQLVKFADRGVQLGMRLIVGQMDVIQKQK